jgi:hypothetical protein
MVYDPGLCVRGHPTGEDPLVAVAGERHRGAELRRRHGWAWLRVFRRLDEYEAALAEARRLGGADGIDAVLAEHDLDAIVAPTGSPATSPSTASS